MSDTSATKQSNQFITMTSNSTITAQKRKASLVPTGFTDNAEGRNSVKRIHIERAATFGQKLFAHQPIDLESSSIRLIEVLPSRDDAGRISCRIRHADTEAEYTCLSYVWGSQDVMQDISINGSLFFVGDGLWQFLKVASSESARANNVGMPTEEDESDGRPTFDFRSATTSLWIDALCIDQDNTLERNHQVQRMGHIYSQAKQVLTWLGNDSASLTHLFSRMRNSEFGELACFEPTCQRGIQLFDANTYWKRAWITQEVSLAKYVFFVSGETAVDLADAYHHLSGAPPELNLVHNDLWLTLMKMRMRSYGQQASFQDSILGNLAVFRSKDCWDIRDKVYSLLGISHDGSGIKVSYDRPVVDLAVDLMRLYEIYFCLCHVNLIRSAFELKDVKTALPVMTMEGRYTVIKTRPNVGQSFHCDHCDHQVEFDSRKLEFELPDWDYGYYSCLKCEHTNWSRETGWEAHYGHVVRPNLSARDNTCFLIPFNGEARKIEGSSQAFTKVDRGKYWLGNPSKQLYPNLEKGSPSKNQGSLLHNMALRNLDLTLSDLLTLSPMPLGPSIRRTPSKAGTWHHDPDPMSESEFAGYMYHGHMRKDSFVAEGHSWRFRTI